MRKIFITFFLTILILVFRSSAVYGQKIPFGINNPFEVLSTTDQDAQEYMNELKDIGVNVLSQHFRRTYKSGQPNFAEHREQILTYVVNNNNYFWPAINPISKQCFIGDINIDTHQIIQTSVDLSNTKKCLPNSEAGIAEWESWLNKSIDLFYEYPNVINKLAYIQLGNEDSESFEKPNAQPNNPNDYYHDTYARIIEESYNIIKTRTTAKILIAAIGTGDVAIEGLYRPLLQNLYNNGDRKCNGTGCFDALDYHNFGNQTHYKERLITKKGITILKNYEFFRNLLNDSGFSDKGLTIQQGATYTGQESYYSGSFTRLYQTEKDQAVYLVKRIVYYISKPDYEQIQHDTFVEISCFGGTIHSPFTLTGLEYNGIPVVGSVPSCHTLEPDPAYFNTSNCDGQLPCPDPGEGIKKLSYYTFKKLIETLKGSDWENVETFNTGVNNTFAYKFILDNKSIYVVWWDWWQECSRDETGCVNQCISSHQGDYAAIDTCVNNCDSACIESKKPTITLSLSNAEATKVTEATPKYTVGKEITNYSTAFNSSTETVIDGKISVTLGKAPVYLEISTLPKDTTAPSAPANLSATAISSSQINLSWTASTDNVGVTGYHIERCQGTNCSNFNLLTTSSSTIYSNTGLSSSTVYRYQVKAFDAVGNNSAQSNIASATTQAQTPTDITSPQISNISVSGLTSNSAIINWTTNEASDSQVEYGLTASYGNSTSPNTSTLTSHSVSLSGLSDSTLYHYRVKSKDQTGNLATSADYTFTTKASVGSDTTSPTIPTNLSATAISSSQINLSWTASTDNVGVTGYRIYRGGIQVGTATITSYSDSGLVANAIYNYKLSAYDAAGNVSVQSASVSATTQPTSSTTPTIYPDGAILKTTTSPDLYVIKDSKRELIPNWQSFLSFGYNLTNLKIIPVSEMAKIEAIDLTKIDSDQDGLTNAQEKQYGTNAAKADTDADGYNDYEEISKGYSPLIPAAPKSNPVFAYGKPRLGSLAQEQEQARVLRRELEKRYTKEQLQGLSAKNWITVVNSYIYGGYPLEAIVKALKFSGKTVHPVIPWDAWQNSRDYLEYIER